MLILGGYLTYGVGTPIATGIAAAPDSLSTVSGSTLFTASAVWMLLNSALVIGIGALMLPILRPHNTNIAFGYFATRVFEGIILAVGVISLLSLVIISRTWRRAPLMPLSLRRWAPSRSTGTSWPTTWRRLGSAWAACSSAI